MTAAPKRSPMLTTVEVAERLNRAPKTIRKWIGRGYFPGAVRPPGGQWLVPEADVKALFDRWGL